MNLRFAPLLAAILAFSPHSAEAAEKLKVVATFSILGDLVSEVGGDAIELKTLVPPGADAHQYEPTPADAKAIAHADILVVNGLDFEGWLSRLVKSANYQGEQVVVSNGIKPIEEAGEHHGHHHEAADPHAWQNVANVKIYVKNIEAALSKKDPAHASLFSRNAKAYTQKLTELDAWVKAEISAIPEQKRKIITTHDAFRYFSKAYKVTFLAPVGISSEAQPSAATLAKLINQMRSDNITAIFLENMTDSRLIKQLEKDANATIGGTLYSDALSTSDGPAASYINMVQHNVPLLVSAMKSNPAK